MSRSTTIAPKRLAKEDRAELREIELEIADIPRPKTRGDCANVPRPCPFVSCKHHLYLEVNPQSRGIKINFPETEIDELQHSCALDVAEDYNTLQKMGNVLNVTRERTRQLEANALEKFRTQMARARLTEGFAEMLNGGSDTKRDLTLYDPNPKRLTWDEWRNKFIPKEPHEPTIAIHSQMLRGWVQRADQNLASHVREALEEGNIDHKGQRVSVVHGEAPSSQRRPQEPRERSHRRSAPVRHEDAHRSQSESPRGSEAKGGQLDAQRNTTGDLGELHLLQDDAARPDDAPPMPEALPAEEAPLPSSEDSGESVGGEAPGPDMAEPRGRTPRPKKYSLDNPRPKKQPPTQCKSDLGRLAYSLRKHSEGQMLSFAAELRHSPYNERLQDSLRRYLADALASGRHNDAQRAQQFLAILLGKEPKQRKEPNMKPEKASQLLDLLAARPDKADLIEALAIEAGLYAPRSTPTPSAALVLDRDVKPEKNKGGRPKKKTSAAEGKKQEKPGERRRLMDNEKDHFQTLLGGGWSRTKLCQEIGLPLGSLSGVLNGQGKAGPESITKLMKFRPQPLAQAAE